MQAKYDWQMICLQLRKHYKSLESIAKEIGATPNALQKIARYGVKSDIGHSLGEALLKLHTRHVPSEKV